MKTIFEQQLSNELINALYEMDRLSKDAVLIDLHGQKFVVLKEKDYRSWKETDHLLSSSKNAEILQNSLDEPLDLCRDLENVLKELEG